MRPVRPLAGDRGDAGSRAARASAVALAVLFVATSGARAWVIEAGVLLDDDDDTVFTPLVELNVTTDAYWNGDAFFIAPFGFDFDGEGCSWAWNITRFEPPFNTSFQGNPGCFGTVRFEGYPGFYEVSGLRGYPDFTISGPTFTVNVVPGEQEFSVRLTSLATSGLRLLLSSRWNPTNDSIASAATILDATGNPIVNATVNHTILRPDGSMFSGLAMTATSVPGVYVANVSVPITEPFGPWTVAAQFGGTVASERVVRGPVPLSGDSTVNLTTSADPYLPLLVWGGVMVFFLFFNAWLPAVGGLMALVNGLLPSPIWSTATSALLVAVLVFVHAIFLAVSTGIVPVPWVRKR